MWIADRLDGSEGSPALSGAIPSGFDALVRVLHPYSRDRLVGMTWAEFIEQVEADPARPVDEPERIDESGITWEVAAAAHNSELAPGSLSHDVLGLEYGDSRNVESADGWRYHSPEEGSLTAPVLARVADVLAAHTSTPERGVAAVWEGWGGLTSAAGVGFFFAIEPPEHLPRVLQAPVMALRRKRLDFQERKRRFGTRSALRSLFGIRGSKPDGTGVLPKQVATGPRLELPARAYFCFEAGIADFAEADGTAWQARAPWIDDPSSWWIQSPNLIWPDGHEWLLLTEIDFDSTLIACSRECADALLAADGVEAVEITRDTQLWP